MPTVVDLARQDPDRKTVTNCAATYLLQVWALAVCRAWSAYLDRKTWPIEALCLNGDEEADQHIASWLQTAQPALRSLHVVHLRLPELLPVLSSLSVNTVSLAPPQRCQCCAQCPCIVAAGQCVCEIGGGALSPEAPSQRSNPSWLLQYFLPAFACCRHLQCSGCLVRARYCRAA